MKPQRAVVYFLIIAFAVSWPLFLVPLAIGSGDPRTRQSVALAAWSLAMWGPGLAAIFATRRVGESLGTLNLRRLGPKRPYLWAWLLPPALAVVTGVLTVLLGAGRFDPSLQLIRSAMAQAPGGDVVLPEVVVALQVIFALTLAPLINLVLALGEELGWRGFLLPRLLPLGQGRAILLSGIIWGVWHAPAIAQGHNYPGRPVLGIFMMIVFTVLAGAIFSWLYLRTLSPWAPGLAHASLNATAGLPIVFLTDFDLAVGGALTGVVGWIAMAAFVGWLVLTCRLPVRDLPSTA